MFILRAAFKEKKTPDAKIGEVAPRPKRWLLGIKITKRIDLEKEMKEENATPAEISYILTMKRQYRLTPERAFDLFSYSRAKSGKTDSLKLNDDLGEFASLEKDYRFTVKEMDAIVALRDRVNQGPLFKRETLTVGDLFLTLQKNAGMLNYTGETVEYDKNGQDLMNDALKSAERSHSVEEARQIKRIGAVLREVSEKLDSKTMEKLLKYRK